MSEDAVFQNCPSCGSAEVPTLVVRAAGKPGHGMSLRCRTCHFEWADNRSSYARAS
jgi:formate dehydrogenase maturation protein FdhE